MTTSYLSTLKPLVQVAIAAALLNQATAYEVNPITATQASEYKLDQSFFQKGTLVQNILIATSKRVADHTHREAAYQFDQVMKNITPAIAQRTAQADDIWESVFPTIMMGDDRAVTEVWINGKRRLN